MATPRIVVIGSCNVDLTAFTERIPRAGETVFGTRFDLGFGGKGPNQAAAARLCGARVAMVAKVGREVFDAEWRRRHATPPGAPLSSAPRREGPT
jgi:ribokinase